MQPKSLPTLQFDLAGYNRFFSVDWLIGTEVISQAEFDHLMGERRIFLTWACLDSETACKLLGGRLEDYPEYPRLYNSLITTERPYDWPEAERIADQRRQVLHMREQIEGVLVNLSIPSPGEHIYTTQKDHKSVRYYGAVIEAKIYE